MDKDRKYILDKEIEVAKLQIEAGKVYNESHKLRLQGYELLYKYAGIALVFIIVNILLWTDTVSNSEFLQWLKSILHIQ